MTYFNLFAKRKNGHDSTTALRTAKPGHHDTGLIRRAGRLFGLLRVLHFHIVKPCTSLFGTNGPKERHQDKYALLQTSLKRLGIQVQKTKGTAPPEAAMHDRAAPTPELVISPQTEWGVTKTLELLKDLDLYKALPISVKSGGHGYFNGASCSGIMLNVGGMKQRRVENNMLYLEPGCTLGHTVFTLKKHHKALPHGDCFGVGAGGHFLTAGWDLILARRYGLGCQSVVGGRIVLWDGSTVDVDETHHPKLLHAMRGGAAAGVGVVTEIRLRLVDEPSLATWCFMRITKEQLAICVSSKAFSNAFQLPRDISVSFRFHFETGQLEPVCSFNICSLLTEDETMFQLDKHLGKEVTSLLADSSQWNERSLFDLRMLPASETLAKNPEMLDEISSEKLHKNPLVYWKETNSSREMASSFFTSISHWVIPECESMLPKLYEAFEVAQEAPARERMYALVIQGGGCMEELQDHCAMPLGKALARFELHWDQSNEERDSRRFTDDISKILRSKEDTKPGRPYRGDIWLEEQAKDAKLEGILREYDQRY